MQKCLEGDFGFTGGTVDKLESIPGYETNISIETFIQNVKNKGISLKKLHEMTGISRAYLFDLENNRKFNPTLFILKKIAEELEVNIKDLFYSSNDIDDLKEEMYRRIDIYGLDSKEVLEVSQVIDLLINIKMKKRLVNEQLEY